MSDNQQTTPASTDPAGVARTPEGQIATGTQTTTSGQTSQTSTTPTEQPSLINEPAGSVVNQPKVEGQGAPETYATFSVPEGYELDAEVAKEAGGLFKGMNLSQEQAQQLVDFYTAKAGQAANEPYKIWNDMQTKWVNEIKNDPVIGPRLNEVKSTISKAIDGMNDPKLAKDFREAMDFTGAGNNPAFIKAFYKLAQMITEGRHVSGNGPSAASQKVNGQPASAARAMYPNLP